MMSQSRRKILGNLAALGLFYPLAACGNRNLLMKKEIVTSKGMSALLPQISKDSCVECMKKRATYRLAFTHKETK